MDDTTKCEVCGRGTTLKAERICSRRHYPENSSMHAECYRLGYSRLSAEVEALRRERDEAVAYGEEIRKRSVDYATQLKECRALNTAAEADAERLREAVGRFGAHAAGCEILRGRASIDWSDGDEDRCDCGLSDARAALSGSPLSGALRAGVLEEALKKARDTFRDMQIAWTALRRDAPALACEIAADHCDAALAQFPGLAPRESVNQCDGCRAGKPLDANGNHIIGEHGGYRDLMTCQKHKYAPAPREEKEQLSGKEGAAHGMRRYRIDIAVTEQDPGGRREFFVVVVTDSEARAREMADAYRTTKPAPREFAILSVEDIGPYTPPDPAPLPQPAPVAATERPPKIKIKEGWGAFPDPAPPSGEPRAAPTETPTNTGASSPKEEAHGSEGEVSRAGSDEQRGDAERRDGGRGGGESALPQVHAVGRAEDGGGQPPGAGVLHGGQDGVPRLHGSAVDPQGTVADSEAAAPALDLEALDFLERAIRLHRPLTEWGQEAIRALPALLRIARAAAAPAGLWTQACEAMKARAAEFLRAQGYWTLAAQTAALPIPPAPSIPEKQPGPTKEELSALLDRGAKGADDLAKSLRAVFRRSENDSPVGSPGPTEGQGGRE